MRFKGLDLNLLVAFEALVSTCSIARTAEILCLSQPAISAALGRLREFFGDELIVRDGRRFHPTVTAMALLPLVRQCLRDADELVAATQTFDPATSKRTFRVIASDYIATVVLTRLATIIGSEAPGVAMDVLGPMTQSATPFQDASVDLMICPEPLASPDHPSELLFEDEFVFAGCKANPIFDSPLTAEGVLSLGHVALSLSQSGPNTFGDQQLEALGVERRVEVLVGSFSCAPWFLPGSQRLLLMHGKLARFFAASTPIAYAPTPFPLTPLRMLLQFHRARRDDAGLVWLRDRIRAAAEAS